MSNKVYIVTAGEYSDYHIEAVFSTKEKAEEYILSLKYDYAYNNYGFTIEEFNTDPKPKGKRNDLINFRIDMKSNGDVDTVIYNNDDYYKTDGSMDMLNNYCSEYYVKAKDEKHAIKIANERRIQHKANNKI